MYIKLQAMNGYVFVTAYGLCLFKTSEKAIHHGTTQYRGKIRLPSKIFTQEWKKWTDLNYWFDENQIFESPEKAISSIKTPNNGENV